MSLRLFCSARGCRSAVLALMTIAVVGGCSSASVTQPPAPTASPAVQTSAPTATPAQESLAPTDVATPTPAPTATPAPTPTPAPTATPAPTPTSRAWACSGSADSKAFFAKAATLLSFNVYCAVLPSGWWLQEGSYVLPNGGYLEVEYKSSSASFEVREGRTCPPSKVCIGPGAPLGPATFAGLPGQLYLNATTYTLIVSTARPYLMVGSGMSKAKFLALAAAFVKVPKA